MPRKYIANTCKNCGKEYQYFATQKPYFQHFCSFECEQEYLNQCDIKSTKCVCKQCGAKFSTLVGYNRNYCSYDCHVNFEHEHNQHQHVCIDCGKPFIAMSNKARFCSKACSSNEVRRRKMLKKLEEHREEYEEIAKRQLPEPNTKVKTIWYEKDGIYARKESMFLYDKNVLKTCVVCGRKFLVAPNATDTVCCSHECFYVHHQQKKEAICVHCGKTYEVKATEINFTQFCSDECERQHYSELEQGIIKKHNCNVKCKCINCGKEYYTFTNQSVFYCSGKCKTDFTHKKRLHETVCKECGTTFTTFKANAQFCSTACGSAFKVKASGMPRNNTVWNKGLTAETSDLIKDSTIKQAKAMKEGIASGRIKMYFTGRKLTEEHKLHCSQGQARAIREGRRLPRPQYVSGVFSDIKHYVRSSWEYNFARILQYCKRFYQYEATTFQLSNGQTYTPDFYDLRRNMYYEVKGAFYEDAREKYQRFLQEYPHIKIHLLENDVWKRIYNHFKTRIKLYPNFNDSHDSNFLSQEEMELLRVSITPLQNGETIKSIGSNKKFNEQMRKAFCPSM